MSRVQKLLLLLLLLVCHSSGADSLRVAVASSFLTTLQQLAVDFKHQSGHELIVSSGSTGLLYAQIKQGAPHDVYMAADTLRPQLLVDAGMAVNFQIYAQGQLVLFSNKTSDEHCPISASDKSIKYFAIANPDLAPYGLAAKQYLENLMLWSSSDFKLVMGENIAQTMQMVATKNASAGLVAKSLVAQYKFNQDQCVTDIESHLHTPIEQAMVLLKRADKSSLFDTFAAYLKTASALEILQNNGYMTGIGDV